MDKALELAEWLENHVCGRETTKEVITMLRQQQAEIEALKEALRMKVILNEHAQQAMKGYKELLK